MVDHSKTDRRLKQPQITHEKDKDEDNDIYYVVDGQHRIEAIKKLKEKDFNIFKKIRDCQLSVVLLKNPELETEIETFININKTAKKVDASLALILKNKLKRQEDVEAISVKKEFIAVELALKLNGTPDVLTNKIWNGRIKLEGSLAKKSYETISLNGFVKTTRTLIGYFNQYKIINLKKWEKKEEVESLINYISELYSKIWYIIEKKWPSLFNESIRNNVIQGNIGVSAINKYILLLLKDEDQYYNYECDAFIEKVKSWINNLNINDAKWISGGEFSNYSSESGSSLIAQMLKDIYKKSIV